VCALLVELRRPTRLEPVCGIPEFMTRGFGKAWKSCGPIDSNLLPALGMRVACNLKTKEDSTGGEMMPMILFCSFDG